MPFIFCGLRYDNMKTTFTNPCKIHTKCLSDRSNGPCFYIIDLKAYKIAFDNITFFFLYSIEPLRSYERTRTKPHAKVN